MSRFKSSLALLALLSPSLGFASDYCVATAGGYGHGGTTFVEPSFSSPAEGKCNSWIGFTKTAGTVVVTTYGTGCLSSDGKALTIAVSSADPDWFGSNAIGMDYISLKRSETSKPFTTGSDTGSFGGDAEVVSCSSSLLELPSSHA